MGTGAILFEFVNDKASALLHAGVSEITRRSRFVAVKSGNRS